MSLEHTFYLISKNFISGHQKYSNYHEILSKNKKSVVISDEIILYIQDSIKWVQRIDPSKNQEGYGLNYHGITIFDEKGLTKLCKIIEAWIFLFENAPDEFELKGNFILHEDGHGYYEKSKFEKNALIKNFRYFFDTKGSDLE